VLAGAAAFFYGLIDSADPSDDPFEILVDACFDLAHTFNQHPDSFLDKPIDDLAFYAEATSRLAKRLNDR